MSYIQSNEQVYYFVTFYIDGKKVTSMPSFSASQIMRKCKKDFPNGTGFQLWKSGGN